VRIDQEAEEYRAKLNYMRRMKGRLTKFFWKSIPKNRWKSKRLDVTRSRANTSDLDLHVTLSRQVTVASLSVPRSWNEQCRMEPSLGVYVGLTRSNSLDRQRRTIDTAAYWPGRGSSSRHYCPGEHKRSEHGLKVVNHRAWDVRHGPAVYTVAQDLHSTSD